MRCDPKEAGIAVAQQEPPGPAPPEKIAPQTNDGSISRAVTTRGALHDGAGASGRSPDLVVATQCAQRAGALTLAVQSRRRHFRAWKNARSVAPVPLALRVTNFVAVAVIVRRAIRQGRLARRSLPGQGTKERGAGAAHDHKEAKQNGLSWIAFSPCESASQAF